MTNLNLNENKNNLLMRINLIETVQILTSAMCCLCDPGTMCSVLKVNRTKFSLHFETICIFILMLMFGHWSQLDNHQFSLNLHDWKKDMPFHSIRNWDQNMTRKKNVPTVKQQFMIMIIIYDCTMPICRTLNTLTIMYVNMESQPSCSERKKMQFK